MIFYIVTSDPRQGGRILFRGQFEAAADSKQALLTATAKKLCGWGGQKTFNRMAGDCLYVSLKDDLGVTTMVSREYIPDEDLRSV